MTIEILQQCFHGLTTTEECLVNLDFAVLLPLSRRDLLLGMRANNLQLERLHLALPVGKKFHHRIEGWLLVLKRACREQMGLVKRGRFDHGAPCVGCAERSQTKPLLKHGRNIGHEIFEGADILLAQTENDLHVGRSVGIPRLLPNSYSMADSCRESTDAEFSQLSAKGNAHVFWLQG